MTARATAKLLAHMKSHGYTHAYPHNDGEPMPEKPSWDIQAGYVLRSPHGHAKILSIKTDNAKAAPGVLTVITAADWKKAGLGELPSHAGLKRRDGSPMFKAAYPVLAEDRVRWVGDPVAFVVAETTAQANDAAEMIEVDYEPLPAVVSTAKATEPGAAKVWDGCADNISFVELLGDKAATDAAFAKAAHVVKHRFVINRVTAAAMEPRGSRSCSSSRSPLVPFSSRATPTSSRATCRTAGWDRSSSARLPRPEQACSRSTGCSGTCAATTTPCSSSTASCSPSSSCS
jgi:CO/xanthine dehydrogenase Mo-binding subunit